MIRLRNRRGQALIEFILIIPILAIFILGMFDIGNILYKKYQLENRLDYIVDLYEENALNTMNAYIQKEGLSINIQHEQDYTTISLLKGVSFVTPGASKIFGSNYMLSTNRVVVNES